MQSSESIIKFAEAFTKAQAQIKFAIKDALNPHLKNKYADLPAVIDAVKEALNSNGLSYMQLPGSMPQAAMLAMTTRLLHVSGEWIEETMHMPLVKTDPQGYGSALTYARRYALAAICGVYQDDDDANNAVNRKKKETISGTDGYFEKCDAATQMMLVGLRDAIHDAMSRKAVQEAYAVAHEVQDDDHKIALWSLLDSKARTALKKEGEVQRTKAAPPQPQEK
jgi:hypothetical protein